MVKFLKDHLEKSGCAIGDNFIKAVHCDMKISGGYVRGAGVLTFCSYRYFSLSYLLVQWNAFDFYCVV